ncbi:MAG TPA: DUF3300 domain-containing protein [Stellaceae bacterium]
MSFRLRILAQTLPFLLMTPGLALAQHAPTRGEATAALNQPAKPGAQQYTRQQIDQLVAPIALYPDQLLSQVLMAATYPDQIVQAAQWTQQGDHSAFKDDALVAALEPMPWDPSVKALCAFPQVVQMMAEHIEWTEALGVAFATQQAEVMTRVQALRHLAMKSDRLSKVKHLKVQEEGQTIVITEAEPGRIFIPVYNPTVVYGEWPDREYPPVFIPPPQGFVSETIEPGLEVSVAYTAVQPLWGWSRVDWRDERITVDRAAYTRITRNVEVGPGDAWQHRGPVVLVAPSASRTTTATANLPAGTVAPARAAAVSVLPQRAAADPTQIKTQSGATETRTTEPGQGQQNHTGTNRPGTQSDQNRATAQQPEKGQSGATQPENAQTGAQPRNAQTGAQPGAAKPEKAQTGTNQPEHGQARTNRREEPQPARNEPTARPGAVQPGHPETAGSSQAKKEGAATAPNPATRPNEREAASPNAAPKPAQAPSPQEREHAKAPPGSPQHTGAPEREGRGMPGQEEHPSARGPERNGAAGTPEQRENPARPPEHGGSSAPPPVQHPAAQPPAGHGPEHAGQQPPAGVPSQPSKPQRPGPEAGQGSSMPPAAAPPQPQPSAQKPQQPGEHAGRPEQKEQNEKKER